MLKAYGISTVTGDRYGGVWPVERFRAHHIKYEQSAKPKSDLYRDILPAINSGKVDLLDNDRLINQLIGLERRTSRGGRDLIDHQPNSHDDLANVIAGVVAALSAKPYGGYDVSMRWVGEVSNESWRSSRLQMFINSGGRYR